MFRNKLLVTTFSLSAIWGSAGALVERTFGDRSLATLLCAMVGFPGLFMANVIDDWLGVRSAAFVWVAAALANWLFYFWGLRMMIILVRKARVQKAIPDQT